MSDVRTKITEIAFKMAYHIYQGFCKDMTLYHLKSALNVKPSEILYTINFKP